MDGPTRLLAAAFAALLVTGCAGHRAVSVPASSSPSTSVTTAPATVALSSSPSAASPAVCQGLPGARAMWLPVRGGRLEADSAGAGPDAVVFFHEISPEGMCGFAAYAAWLVAHYPTVQVELVNRCGYGASVCPSATTTTNIVTETEPAIAWARSHGARRITLVGASGGGMDALEAAALIPGIAAVIDLSGDVNDTGANDNALVRRITIPALLAAAPDDQFVSVAAMRGYYAKIPARIKRLLIENNDPSAHGWDLLNGANGQPPSPLAVTVADWAVGDIN